MVVFKSIIITVSLIEKARYVYYNRKYMRLNVVGLKTFFVGVICCFMAFSSASVSYAQITLGLDDLLKLDIEDLADVQVSVVSKKNEKLSEAPGVISLVTRNEIKKYGALTLLDIFDRVPSLQVYSSAFAPNNNLSIRGGSNQHYTNRILFLINGRPYRESHTGGWNIPFFLGFPVSIIERVEVIRGPGSVLYGSNAYTGVINIVTRKGDDNALDPEVQATYGTFNTQQVEAVGGYSGTDYAVTMAYKKFTDEGWDYRITDEVGTTGAFDQSKTGYGLFSNGRYKDFSFDAYVGQAKQINLGSNSQLPGAPINIRRWMVDTGYHHEFNDNVKMQANITYNAYVPGDTFDSRNFSNSAHEILGEVNIHAVATDKLNLLIGGTVENIDGQISSSQYNSQSYSGYFQADYKLFSWLKIVGGYQSNKIKGVSREYSPRFSAVASLPYNLKAKFLYSQAFRSPNAIESYILVPNVLVGNTTLKPENIETYEAQLSYSSSRVYSAVTYYDSKIADQIGRGANPMGAGLIFVNQGHVNFKGVEIEGKYNVSQKWSFQGSWMWQRNEDDAGLNETTFTPNIMAKLGVSYSDPGERYTVGVFDSYYGQPQPVSYIDPTVNNVNPKARSYHLLTAKVGLNLDKITSHSLFQKSKLTLYGDNLLDEDIYYPEFNRKNINTMPIHAGRALYLTYIKAF